MGRIKQITDSEEKRIKELFKYYGKFRTVAAIVKRDPMTIKKVLGIKPKKDIVPDGCFDLNDYNNSIIL